jgi:ribose transport system ATP-binding protein
MLPEAVVHDPTQRSKPLLSIRGLTKTFPGTTALDRVDFTLEPGEVHALVGQNGSGKSTLVKVLAGFVEADQGALIELDGSEVEIHDTAATHELGLRFVHQDLGLVAELDAVENLALGSGFLTGFAGRIRWDEQRREAQERLQSLGYDFDVRRPVRELAAAERTGIAIVRALYHWEQARVLVLDEPTASLPRHEVSALFDAVKLVRDRGLGVVYISHRLDEVFDVSDRVTVLRDGRKVGTYLTDDLNEDRLISLMIGHSRTRAQLLQARPSDSPAVLEADGLCGVTVDNVRLVARRGEVLGVAGLTGSGRDELLRLMFGVLPRHGSVQVNGVDVRSESPSASVAAGLAYVPADRHAEGSIPAMSVRENCTLTDLRRFSGAGGRLHGRAERAEVAGWIESLDVRPPRGEALFGTLSGGNQQKVVLAKWLRMAPSVLLLDEPTQGVDVGAKSTIHDLARAAADEGMTVVIASSDDIELCERCDRILVMRDGVIVADVDGPSTTPEELARLQLGAA